MKPVIQHYISAYQAMQDFILQMLRSLPKNCRPNNWFGYVVYQKVQNYAMNEVRTNIALTTNTKTVYTGTVFVEGGEAASASAYAAYSNETYNNSSSIEVSCKGGRETTSRQDVLKDVAEGKTTGNPTSAFSFVVYPDTYDLSVRFFPVNMTGQRTTSTKITATSCTEGHEKKESEPFTKEIPAYGHHVMNEKINRASPDYLEGSRVERPRDINDKVGFGSTTITEDIKLRWMLRRLPAR